jgi:hypothetical protein
MIQFEAKRFGQLELDKAIVLLRKQPAAETNEEHRVKFRDLAIKLFNECQYCKLMESARLCDILYQRLADPFAHPQAWFGSRQRRGPKTIPPRSFSTLDEDFCEIKSRIVEELDASRIPVSVLEDAKGGYVRQTPKPRVFLPDGTTRKTLRRKKLRKTAGPPYALHKELGVWTLVFEGKSAVLKHEKGLIYVNYLLKNPPSAPLHGVELAELAIGQAIIQEANLSGDSVGSNAKIIQLATELKEVIQDPTATEKAKEDARKELGELADIQKSIRKTRATNLEKTVRAIRRALVRLQKRLANAREGGKPHTVLVPFAEHLLKHLLIPSERYGRHRAKTGVAGCFTYEPPAGLIWAD